eukprot:SM000067S20346  [mRNA]  locus=s67:394120:401104:- [translate_table: standard]
MASAGANNAAGGESRPLPSRPAKRPRPAPELPSPVSDAATHARFVDKLLARSDAQGKLLERGAAAGQGSGPRGAPSVDKYTPLELQVLDLKRRYPDVLLMVEVGYKYRFFGEDAEKAARVLGVFAYYSRAFLTASVPVFRLHVHVRRLVEAGHKVGVVRQTETAAIKAHGDNRSGPFTRGLSALYTAATLEAAEDLGGNSSDADARGRLTSYLVCVTERPLAGGKGDSPQGPRGDRVADVRVGLVAVEAATGDVAFDEFNDRAARPELEARLLALAPAELLLAEPLSASTDKVLLDYVGPSARVRVERVPRARVANGGALAEVASFYADGAPVAISKGAPSDGGNGIDEGLQAIMAMPELAVQALALAVAHLQQFGLQDMLRLGASFRPLSVGGEMTLSPNALAQLEVLRNSLDGQEHGSLLWLLDHTCTPSGGRLLRHWVTHPLQDQRQIEDRLDAVAELLASLGSSTGLSEGTYPGSGKGGGIVGAASRGRGTATIAAAGPWALVPEVLAALGRGSDVERGITRIFHRTATPAEFVAVMQSLLSASKQLSRIGPVTVSSDAGVPEVDALEEVRGPPTGSSRQSLLSRLLAAATSVTVRQHAARLLSALDAEAASRGDKLSLLVTTGGRFLAVARCREGIKAAESRLSELLPDLRKLLRSPSLEFATVSGTSYLVEARVTAEIVPVAQRVPGDWIKVSSTKRCNRYHPPAVLAAYNTLALAREELLAACNAGWHEFLGEFAGLYADFRGAVRALAALDCLHSLALVARNTGYVRPHFARSDEPAQLIIREGRHPVLEAQLAERFVPNDTLLLGEGERCQIITGPNMGGKSCYIRQVALIAIMAQIGSFVPATSVRLRVLDAIMTRMGASDSLQRGRSTFLEELGEASDILRLATGRSLVICDELGRGTSTHDGVAIAFATLQYLLETTKCLTLFVTHYPKISELQIDFPKQLGCYYVSFLASTARSNEARTPEANAADDSAGDSSRNAGASDSVTFLYKLAPGVAPRSFGLHVARLAEIPETVVRRAADMALKLEDEVGKRKTGLGSMKLEPREVDVATYYTESADHSEDPQIRTESGVCGSSREFLADVADQVEGPGVNDMIRSLVKLRTSLCADRITFRHIIEFSG